MYWKPFFAALPTSCVSPFLFADETFDMLPQDTTIGMFTITKKYSTRKEELIESRDELTVTFRKIKKLLLKSPVFVQEYNVKLFTFERFVWAYSLWHRMKQHDVIFPVPTTVTHQPNVTAKALAYSIEGGNYVIRALSAFAPGEWVGINAMLTLIDCCIHGHSLHAQ